MGTLCSRQKSPPDSSSAGDDGHAATSGGEKEAQTAERATAPHKFQEIIANEKSTNAATAQEDQTDAGIFFAGKTTKKCWVDEKTRYHCFMLFPRGLSITWSENPEYWTWHPLKEASDTEIETASLKAVCWLDIQGKQELSDLTPGVPYEVAFVVMVNEWSKGWAIPVKLGLKLPDGTVRQLEEKLQEKPKGQWLEIKVGEVKAQQGLKGLMEISMFEHGSHWKTGLLLKGIKIVPKSSA